MSLTTVKPRNLKPLFWLAELAASIRAIPVQCASRFSWASQWRNPHPCGFFGDAKRECHCSPVQIQRYVSKISGPLLDRIDIHIEVPAVQYKELRGDVEIESSACVRSRVVRAREMQAERYRSEKSTYANSQTPPELIRKHCAITPEGEKILETAIQRLGLSARARDRILKVSRSIATSKAPRPSPLNISAKPSHTAPSTAPTGRDTAEKHSQNLPARLVVALRGFVDHTRLARKCFG